MTLEPINRELFERTAPAWNCVTDPGKGPHYTPHGDCEWCAMPAEAIRAERASNEAPPHTVRCWGCNRATLYLDNGLWREVESDEPHTCEWTYPK